MSENETVINYELLDFTMKYIKTKPENHNQGNWFEGELGIESGTHVADQNICGTAGCFAGWASIFGGWHQIRPHEACIDCNTAKSEVTLNPSCASIGCDYAKRYDLVVNAAGEIKSMEHAATETLGLTREQASELFKGHNTREELDEMVNKLHDDGNAVL